MVDADTADRHRLDQLERVRVAEVEATEPLGDDDRVLPVRREVHVVRIVDRDGYAGSSRPGVDRRQAVAAVVGDVQRLRSHAGTTCCGRTPTAKWSITVAVVGVDDVDGIAHRIRDVDRGGSCFTTEDSSSAGRARRCRPAQPPAWPEASSAATDRRCARPRRIRRRLLPRCSSRCCCKLPARSQRVRTALVGD